MKKNYFILVALFSGSLAFGQSAVNTTIVGKTLPTQEIKPTSVNQSKVSLYQNNFGTPADWSFQVNGTANHNWVIGTTAPSGSFPIAAIASSSASDGFALFDSDLLCGADGSQNSDVRLVNPVDLTGQAAVQVTFQSHYRKYQGTCYVIASTDGTNWDEYEVHAGLAVNASTTNPQLTAVNVSPTIGGSSTAYIGFRYKGGCDYAWMVDDVQIETLPDDDVAVNSVWSNDIILDYEYSMMPDEQVSTMNIMAVVSNNGALAQTNVPFVLSIDLGGSQVYTETMNVDLAVAEIDTIVFTTTYTPSTIGNYDITVTCPVDDVAGNEEAATIYSTTDFVFGHDFLGTGIFRFDQDEETSMGNVYLMNVDQDLRAVQVEFETGTTPEVEVVAEIWLVGANIQDLTYVYEQYYTVPAAQIGANKTTNIVLDIPQTLTAGNQYIIDIKKPAGPTRVFFGGSNEGDDDFSTACFGPFGTGGAVNFYNGWGFSPAVRANFNPAASINVASELEGVAVYPNPSEGIVTVSNDLNVENTITVTDLNGRVVASKVASTSTTIDLSTVGTGVYLVNVENTNGKKVERVVIK